MGKTGSQHNAEELLRAYKGDYERASQALRGIDCALCISEMFWYNLAVRLCGYSSVAQPSCKYRYRFSALSTESIAQINIPNRAGIAQLIE